MSEQQARPPGPGDDAGEKDELAGVAHEDGPIEVVAQVADPTRVRRAPRFGAFVFVGIALAFLLAGLLSFVRDSFLPPEEVAARALDSWGIFWLLLLGLGAFFALASFAVAVWIDHRSVRRAECVRAAAPSSAATPDPTPAAPLAPPTAPRASTRESEA